MSGRPPAGAGPIIIEQGDGAWVTDVDGNRYLDGLSGQWCVNVGYGRKRLADAAAAQLTKLAFHPLTRGHVPAIELGERLDGLLGGNRASYYANSGSEANELAFKLVRQYHDLRGEPHRFKIIARYRAYHGSTLGAMSATGQALRRFGYEPLAPGFLHIPPPDPYRDGIAADDLEDYGRRCAVRPCSRPDSRRPLLRRRTRCHRSVRPRACHPRATTRRDPRGEQWRGRAAQRGDRGRGRQAEDRR
jgi:adenosylmethionine-8-amino-7-oxononanoate aminotransferase